MAVGDFNADGKPDVVIGCSPASGYSKPLQVFYNTGRTDRPYEGKPSLVFNVTPRGNYVRDTITVADWNNDGIDDLVVAMGQDKNVYICLGGPTGLDPKRIVTIPLDFCLHFEHSICVADFNGDGRMDLGMFGYLLGSGIGAYGPNAVYVWIAPDGQPAQPNGGK
jgi:hypothetical protein